MRYYSFEVNYNNCPETFTYYFRAKSGEQVAKATGVDIRRVVERTEHDINEAMRHGQHIDTVVRGRLVESV